VARLKKNKSIRSTRDSDYHKDPLHRNRANITFADDKSLLLGSDKKLATICPFEASSGGALVPFDYFIGNQGVAGSTIVRGNNYSSRVTYPAGTKLIKIKGAGGTGGRGVTIYWTIHGSVDLVKKTYSGFRRTSGNGFTAIETCGVSDVTIGSSAPGCSCKIDAPNDTSIDIHLCAGTGSPVLELDFYR
jgi:hypothetical protein